jgi:hypothetical protein
MNDAKKSYSPVISPVQQGAKSQKKMSRYNNDKSEAKPEKAKRSRTSKEEAIEEVMNANFEKNPSCKEDYDTREKSPSIAVPVQDLFSENKTLPWPLGLCPRYGT